MRLDATIPGDTLIALIHTLMPLRMELGGDTGSERHLTLSDPERVELLEGRGLLLACRAHVRWPVLGMRLPVPIRAITVVLEPRMRKRGGKHVLAFGLHIERADLAGLPAAMEARILDWVNTALRERETALAWDVQRTFDRSFALPAMLSTLESFDLALNEASLAVAGDALRVSFVLAPGLTRAG